MAADLTNQPFLDRDAACANAIVANEEPFGRVLPAPGSCPAGQAAARLDASRGDPSRDDFALIRSYWADPKPFDAERDREQAKINAAFNAKLRAELAQLGYI